MYKWAYKNKEHIERILASPGAVGICPVCGEELLAKCGQVNAWHWSHQSNSICDRWWENKTPWHREWQNKWPDACQEVVFDRHIADVCVGNTIIEFQHSRLDESVFLERTVFYLSLGRHLRWVVDATAFTHTLVSGEYQDNGDMFCNNTVFGSIYAGRMHDPTYQSPNAIILFDFGWDMLITFDVYKNKEHWPPELHNYKEQWHGFMGDHRSFLQRHKAP